MTRKIINRALLLLVVGAMSLPAQSLFQDLPWEELAAKAREKVNLNLEGPLLGFASQMMHDTDPDEAKVKKLLAGLKGIYVRSLEFDSDNQYSMADVQKVRSKLTGNNWSQIMDAAERNGETTGVYMQFDGKQISGLVVIAAEARELTMVQIAGTMDPNDMAALGGNFGIPRIDFSNMGKAAAKSAGKAVKSAEKAVK